MNSNTPRNEEQPSKPINNLIKKNGNHSKDENQFHIDLHVSSTSDTQVIQHSDLLPSPVHIADFDNLCHLFRDGDMDTDDYSDFNPSNLEDSDDEDTEFTVHIPAQDLHPKSMIIRKENSVMNKDDIHHQYQSLCLPHDGLIPMTTSLVDESYDSSSIFRTKYEVRRTRRDSSFHEPTVSLRVAESQTRIVPTLTEKISDRSIANESGLTLYQLVGTFIRISTKQSLIKTILYAAAYASVTMAGAYGVYHYHFTDQRPEIDELFVSGVDQTESEYCAEHLYEPTQEHMERNLLSADAGNGIWTGVDYANWRRTFTNSGTVGEIFEDKQAFESKQKTITLSMKLTVNGGSGAIRIECTVNNKSPENIQKRGGPPNEQVEVSFQVYTTCSGAEGGSIEWRFLQDGTVYMGPIVIKPYRIPSDSKKDAKPYAISSRSLSSGQITALLGLEGKLEIKTKVPTGLPPLHPPAKKHIAIDEQDSGYEPDIDEPQQRTIESPTAVPSISPLTPTTEGSTDDLTTAP